MGRNVRQPVGFQSARSPSCLPLDNSSGSIGDFAAPVELLFLPGTCAGSCTRACSCTCAGSCTCAPLLASICAPCAPVFTSILPSCTPLLTPHHAGSLGLSVGYRQGRSGHGGGERNTFSENRKSLSTGDRFRIEDLTHGQYLQTRWWMLMRTQLQRYCLDLDQRAKSLTRAHARWSTRRIAEAQPSPAEHRGRRRSGASYDGRQQCPISTSMVFPRGCGGCLNNCCWRWSMRRR